MAGLTTLIAIDVGDTEAGQKRIVSMIAEGRVKVDGMMILAVANMMMTTKKW